MVRTTIINKVVNDYFSSQPEVHVITAKELMPQLIEAGVYSSNHRDGLPLRDDLRALQRNDQLHFIPCAFADDKEVNTNWYFKRISGGEVRRQPASWLEYCESKLNLLCSKTGKSFDRIYSSLPITSGIYLITSMTTNGFEEAYYVGRTKNLRQRIYNNHLMGPTSNARLKKYLMDEFGWDKFNKEKLREAKDFMVQHCLVRWITEEEISLNNPFPNEHDYRLRNTLEGYITCCLFPRFGLYEEH